MKAMAMIGMLIGAPEDAQFIFITYEGSIVITDAVSKNFGLLAHYVWLGLIILGTMLALYEDFSKNWFIDIVFIVKMLFVLAPTLFYFLPRLVRKRREESVSVE